MQGQERRLEGEDAKQQQNRRARRTQIGLRCLSHEQGQMGQVQGAEEAIEEAGGDQEERGTGQVDHYIVQARQGPGGATAMQDQAVGGQQQDLEEDEEVEQIAGEEGAVEAEQLQLEQDMKVPALDIQALAGVPEGEQGQQGRDHQHPGRQPIRHQDDAVGRGPVAQGMDQDGTVQGGIQQGQGQHDLHRHRQEAQAPPPA